MTTCAEVDIFLAEMTDWLYFFTDSHYFTDKRQHFKIVKRMSLFWLIVWLNQNVFLYQFEENWNIFSKKNGCTLLQNSKI